jgi:hypothetical protein
MVKWRIGQEKPGESPRCQNCTRQPQLVPMRFVSVCGDGHLDDVDWSRWAHSGQARNREQRQCAKPRLKFEHVGGVGGGLESVAVHCSTCGASRDLKSLTSPEALKRIGIRCRGRQPWQYPTEGERCGETPIVLQRGASSVHFPVVASAIDIPPDSSWGAWGSSSARIKNNANLKLLLSDPKHPLRDRLIDLVCHTENVTAQEVHAVLEEQLGGAAAVVQDGDTADIAPREWAALTNPAATHHPRDNFVSERTAFPSEEGHGVMQTVADILAELIDDVILVKRLREIRVLRGFRRHTMKRIVPVDLVGHPDFLPAIEIFGEGIFLKLREDALSTWETDKDVVRRSTLLRKRLSESFRAKWLPDAMPRFLLMHTLAHILIRQLAFDAGYSASSLRERLYHGASHDGGPMAGILIYTAAGDSEGTLGGLARLGEADRLLPAIASAVGSAEWCSLDPVCRESSAQGPDGLSLAACHACALVAETSCETGNVLLDRALLVDPDFGFMRSVVAALIEARAEAVD